MDVSRPDYAENLLSGQRNAQRSYGSAIRDNPIVLALG